MALAYPNTYHVGMSNLGFQIIRQLADETPGWSCDRVFLPDDDRGQVGRRPQETLRTFERGVLLSDVDLLAFSVSYELDLVNVVRILDLSDIPVRGVERDERMPLVAVGGACASLNVEPMADFVDFVFVGEGEEVLGEVLLALSATSGQSRDERKRQLAGISGVYVPSLYEPDYEADGSFAGMRTLSSAPAHIRRRTVRELADYETASTILSPDTEFAGMRLVEVSRGCPRGCRFCVVPTCFQPVRFRPADQVLVLGREHRRVGLLGAAASDHPDIEKIIIELAGQGHELSISATRSEPLSRRALAALVNAGQRTLTLAPEAGDQKLLDITRKNVSPDQILRTAETAAEVGFANLKLYFMVGLPSAGEDEARDVLAFASEIARAARGVRVSLSVNPFVPKPGTPFQWAAMAPSNELKAKLATIQRGAFRLPGSPRAVCEGPRWSVVEALLSRGDRGLCSVIEAAARRSGGYSDFRRALVENGLDLDWYVHRERGEHEPFPWEVLDTGTSRKALWNQWLLARTE